MVGGGATGVAGCTFGVLALRSAARQLDRYPAPLFFLFGTIALLSAAADVRMIARGGLRGRQRLARHVTRMCFGMFIAAGSFFLGQAKVIPKPIRIFPVLTTLALLPLAAMVYWTIRVRFTHWARRPDRSASTRTARATNRVALSSE